MIDFLNRMLLIDKSVSAAYILFFVAFSTMVIYLVFRISIKCFIKIYKNIWGKK